MKTTANLSVSSRKPFGRRKGDKVVRGKVISTNEVRTLRGSPSRDGTVVGKSTTPDGIPKRGRGRPKKLNFEKTESNVAVNEEGAEFGDDEDSMVVQETETDAMAIDDGKTQPTGTIKRGRGRPRKNTLVTTNSEQPTTPFRPPNANDNDATEQTKGSRGRLRKYPRAQDSPSSSMANSVPSTPERGPGRLAKKGVARKITKKQAASPSPANHGRRVSEITAGQLSAFIADDDESANENANKNDKVEEGGDTVMGETDKEAKFTKTLTQTMKRKKEVEDDVPSILSSRDRTRAQSQISSTSAAAPAAMMAPDNKKTKISTRSAKPTKQRPKSVGESSKSEVEGAIKTKTSDAEIDTSTSKVASSALASILDTGVVTEGEGAEADDEGDGGNAGAHEDGVRTQDDEEG